MGVLRISFTSKESLFRCSKRCSNSGRSEASVAFPSEPPICLLQLTCWGENTETKQQPQQNWMSWHSPASASESKRVHTLRAPERTTHTQGRSRTVWSFDNSITSKEIRQILKKMHPLYRKLERGGKWTVEWKKKERKEKKTDKAFWSWAGALALIPISVHSHLPSLFPRTLCLVTTAATTIGAQSHILCAGRFPTWTLIFTTIKNHHHSGQAH